MEKTILITGATSDVGQKLINRVYNHYDKIICHFYHDASLLENMREHLGEKIIPVQADFSNSLSVQKFANAIKENYQVTHLVHLSSPKCINQKFIKTEREAYEEHMQIQFYSVVEILKSCLQGMTKRNYGRVVIMLSSYTNGTAPKYLVPYVSAKYALLGLVKTLASEYVAKNISINGVSPGMMRTKFLSELPEIAIEMQEQNSSKGSLVDIESVVSSIELLLSDEAEFITGKNIIIDGEA